MQLSENYESLTLILLMWRIGWAPNNASKWQMGFNTAFKGLRVKNEGCSQDWYILSWFNWKIWDFRRDTHVVFQVTVVTKFCMVVPDICVSSVFNWHLVSLLEPRILRWLPYFCKIYAPLDLHIAVMLYENFVFLYRTRC